MQAHKMFLAKIWAESEKLFAEYSPLDKIVYVLFLDSQVLALALALISFGQSQMVIALSVICEYFASQNV